MDVQGGAKGGRRNIYLGILIQGGGGVKEKEIYESTK